MEIYSALKAAWHTDDIKALREGKPIVPHHVYLVISDLCNQDCHFCTYRSSAGWGSENFGADTGKGFTMNPNRMIPKDKAIEILDDCADLGVKAVQFTGGGEPSVHPHAEEIIRHALDRGLQVGMVTNATRLLSSRTTERLSWVRVSIDAGNRRSYEAIRKSKLWDKVLANVEVLARTKGPVVGANFVVTKDNYTELSQFCILAKTLGVRYVKIAANLATDGVDYYSDRMLDEIGQHIKTQRRLEDDTFKIVSVFERRLEDLRIGRPAHAFCGQQHFATYIGGDQKVYRCCNTGYTHQGEIGDLRHQRLCDWLKNEAPAALGLFDARTCTHCQFHERNEAIAYLVQKAPVHVEFV
jgi:MoaA/NifB/PqqE/SkfB family radical SAM enzyme